MKTKNSKYNSIILIVIVLMFILLALLMILLKRYENEVDNTTNTTDIAITTDTEETPKTVQEVIESYGSEYIDREEKIFIYTYVNFLYDLYDEDGNSKKAYFYNMIDDIVEIEKASFYLIDNDKNIEIFVVYDESKDTYTVRINDSETYYDDTDGDVYIALQNAGIVESSSFAINNSFILQLTNNNMKYSGTSLFPQDTRVDMGNGYYSIEDGTILGRLYGGKVLNLLFEEGYEEEITSGGIKVGTSLSTVYEKYSDNAFGSVSEGYLGYRTSTAYVFIYRDEISVYGYKYDENEYFDEYLESYCTTGDLETLYKNFTTDWVTYFEKEYDPDTQSLKVTFPTRGIDIDIKNNDSTGIKIYSNYYLTDTVTQLIKDGKITYVGDKDLINETEKTRRANW